MFPIHAARRLRASSVMHKSWVETYFPGSKPVTIPQSWLVHSKATYPYTQIYQCDYVGKCVFLTINDREIWMWVFNAPYFIPHASLMNFKNKTFRENISPKFTEDQIETLCYKLKAKIVAWLATLGD